MWLSQEMTFVTSNAEMIYRHHLVSTQVLRGVDVQDREPSAPWDCILYTHEEESHASNTRESKNVASEVLRVNIACIFISWNHVPNAFSRATRLNTDIRGELLSTERISQPWRTMS
mmetsp:Transcript_7944/g.11818  ORF Transcript_7944/g.11818 Transcript_7944/m.11818 type:complete len:116 (+) Transcript_7944:139-486(+)